MNELLISLLPGMGWVGGASWARGGWSDKVGSAYRELQEAPSDHSASCQPDWSSPALAPCIHTSEGHAMKGHSRAGQTHISLT